MSPDIGARGGLSLRGAPPGPDSPLPWRLTGCASWFKLLPGRVPTAPQRPPWLGNEMSWSLFPAGVGRAENDLRGWGGRGGLWSSEGILGAGLGVPQWEPCPEHHAGSPGLCSEAGPLRSQPLRRPLAIQPGSCRPVPRDCLGGGGKGAEVGGTPMTWTPEHWPHGARELSRGSGVQQGCLRPPRWGAGQKLQLWAVGGSTCLHSRMALQSGVCQEREPPPKAFTPEGAE